MQRIYAPWRSEYLGSSGGECVFCAIANNPQDDEVNRVFYRDERVYAVMNRYPYTPGHFMLVPNLHCDSPEILPLETWLHMHRLSHRAIEMLCVCGAHGANMGLNVKKAGGAGIPEHLHLHFVPRYMGDTNFMTSVANTRTYGINFDEVYQNTKKMAQKYFT